MAGYKETPRQKMISMMYLVLTALLALNVSVEILKAFVIVNSGIVSTNKSFAGKIDWTMNKFKQQYAINQNKVGPFWDKAVKASKNADDLINYIEYLKLHVVMASEKVDSATAIKEFFKVDYRPSPLKPNDSIALVTLQLQDVPTRDKYDESTRFFIGGSADGSTGKARDLRDKITQFKKDMLVLVDPAAQKDFKMGLNTDGPFYDADRKKQNFEMHHFYHTILAADITILNKFINEIQTIEFDVVNHLYSSISAEDFKFDAITARVVPQTRYVFQGEDYNAEIFVAAYDTKTSPEVYILDGADTIIEAELFGYEKGYFPGTSTRKIGKFEMANKGTLFLDEISEMDMNMQSKLLRALQEKEFTRLGGNEIIKTDVRLIVATNKSLGEEVQKGKFRQDLYYRLLGLPIELPPLRYRGNDILILAKHFVDDFCNENNIKKLSITPSAQEKLMKYSYPGNVRELKAIMELACVMANSDIIDDIDISFNASVPRSDFLMEENTLEGYTRKIIRFYLQKYNNNVLLVAEKLDIGKSTIYRMLKNKEL